MDKNYILEKELNYKQEMEIFRQSRKMYTAQSYFFMSNMVCARILGMKRYVIHIFYYRPFHRFILREFDNEYLGFMGFLNQNYYDKDNTKYSMYAYDIYAYDYEEAKEILTSFISHLSIIQ